MSTQPNEEIPKIGLAQFNHVKQASKKVEIIFLEL